MRKFKPGMVYWNTMELMEKTLCDSGLSEYGRAVSYYMGRIKRSMG
jgi:hypothetical protein